VEEEVEEVEEVDVKVHLVVVEEVEDEVEVEVEVDEVVVDEVVDVVSCNGSMAIIAPIVLLVPTPLMIQELLPVALD
jgi:folate-dependent phosphoribosylglycinamide formyltransferase PurN